MKRAGLLGLFLSLGLLAGCGSGGGGCPGCFRDGGSHDGGTHLGGPDMATPPGAKRVFVTRTTYTGNLLRLGGASGLDAADHVCATAAQGALLGGGQWMVWLSDSLNDAGPRMADVGPWYLVGSSTKVFNNKANLAGTPLAPIDRDENGTPISFGDHVWTGTSNGGLRTDASCLNWQDESGEGVGTIGTVGNPGSWTDDPQAGPAPCSADDQFHLYCFEQ